MSRQLLRLILALLVMGAGYALVLVGGPDEAEAASVVESAESARRESERWERQHAVDVLGDAGWQVSPPEAEDGC